MSWQPEVDEIRRREALARQMGGTENVERQHRNGRLTIRERIDCLLDAGSFHETGALAGRAGYDDGGQLISFVPSNYVFGRPHRWAARGRRR
jgi:acetyl-CoA carboxylase carboxyltransferase component